MTMANFAVSYEHSCEFKEFSILWSYGYGTTITVTFRQPFVAEVLGSGFNIPQSEGFFMLHHPCIKEIHSDRSWQDTVRLEELSRMADKARKVPAVSKELDGAAQKVTANC